MAGSKKKRSLYQGLRNYVMTLVILVILLVVCIIGATPLGEKITQGLDLQGGVSVIMSASKPDGGEITQQDMNQAVNVVTNRVNALGASEATVQKSGDTNIQVQIPGATDPEQAIEAIGRTGLLEFVNLLDIQDPDKITAIRSGEQDVTLEPGTYTAFMTGASLEQVMVDRQDQSSPYYSVNLRLDGEGAKKFAEVTRELAPVKGQIAIVIDGKVDSAPAVQTEIPNGEVQITGGYSLEGANTLKTILDSGSLPVNLDYAESRVVGPTLGQDSLNSAVIAIAVGFLIVATYLLFFYKGLGLLTAGSLGVFAIIYLGVLAALSHSGNFALSLPGIAGIVLTIGMAADSSILVIERFKEEIRMGRTVRTASASGTKHGIKTSIDANIVSLVSAVALFMLASGPVKGFGLTLMLGIICDIVTMFIFKLPAMRLLGQNEIRRHPGFWGITTDLIDGGHIDDKDDLHKDDNNGNKTNTSSGGTKKKKRRKKSSAAERAAAREGALKGGERSV